MGRSEIQRSSRLAWAPALVAAATLLLLALPQNAAAEAATDAQVTAARSVVEEMLRDLGETASDPDLTVGQRRRLLADILIDHLDYGAMTRRALGPLAEKFSAEERSDFTVAYARNVTVNLIRQVELGGEAPARIVGARALGTEGAVEVTFEGRERAIGAPLAPTRTRGPVETRLALRERSGDWRIATVRVAGVDNTEIFRSQAQSILDTGSPAELIADLEERTSKFVESSGASD